MSDQQDKSRDEKPATIRGIMSLASHYAAAWHRDESIDYPMKFKVPEAERKLREYVERFAAETIARMAEEKAAVQADNARLRNALNHVDEYLDGVPHGDNCFVSNHYEGDPGNRCNCGKDAVCQNVDEALAHYPITKGE